MAGPANEADEILRSWVQDNSSVFGYVVVNADGIPVKHHERLSYAKAIQYAALFTTFCLKSRQCIRELLSTDNDMISVSLRTSDGSELIALTVQGYTLIVIQNCSGKPYEYTDLSDQSEQEWCEQ